MSKTIQAYIDRHPDKFESWHTEDCDNKTQYWIYCKDPYFSPDMETQTINEFTVRDALILMKAVKEGRFNGYGWGR